MSFSTDLNTVTNQTFVQTTDATVTTIAQIHVYPDSVLNITAFVTGKRTGGASGTAGDSAGYELNAVFKNPSGTGATLVGAVSQIANEDQVAWDSTITTDANGNVLVTVTGASGNNVNWGCITSVVKTQ